MITKASTPTIIPANTPIEILLNGDLTVIPNDLELSVVDEQLELRLDDKYVPGVE